MDNRNVIPLEPHYETISRVAEYLNQQVLGQQALVTRLLVALLADGHLLVEGAPGLAKTKAIKSLAQCLEAEFHRIQFTPDLLPADLTGTDIYRPETGEFVFQPGPIFHNLLLADEINRAPAKVQSALLEAMGERQISIGQTTYQLPDLFLVMATQNPIEQEGTYPLPEAQLDRFMMYCKVDYPNADTEHHILRLADIEAKRGHHANVQAPHQISATTIQAIRQEILDVHLSPALQEYIVQLVVATRQPEKYGLQLQQWLRFGASPRATIALARVARTHAWLNNRDYATPEDVHVLAPDVLRHRIILSYEAQAEGRTTDDIITDLLSHIAIP